ncbi:hypothetical protein IV102_15110 [bacterium]|nr:hypothetical protein [bacterium]
MNQQDRELTLLQLISQVSKRGEWSGASYLQALTYLLEQATQTAYQFEHYWFRGGPYSSIVAAALSDLRADGLIAYDSVVLPAGPAYRCTEAGERRMASCDSGEISGLAESFFSRPGDQRLLLARAAYAMTNHHDNPLEWLEELGLERDPAQDALEAAQELLASRCRPKVPA